MSNPRYGSGRKQFVGHGIEADLGKLDPAAYPGAVAYSNGELYYSDGSEWVVPQDEVDIARPRNLAPTNETEQTQLRLSTFRSPTGETQTGIIFEINTAGLPEFGQGASLITRTVTSQVASLYQIVYPDDGFQPGSTIWWRARYLGTNSTQSQFSIPTAQLFPDVITKPSPVTAVNAITGTVIVTPYNSPAIFGLLYTKTQAEFYTVGSTPGVSTPIATAEHTNGAVTNVPNTLVAGTQYLWRVRYEGRAGIGSPFIYSSWSDARTLVAGGNSMILEYNVTLATGRTIYIPLGGTVNVSVNWGDGVTETFTTAGVKSHTYASGFGPTVLVTISGTLTQYGFNAFIDQSGLTRVENFGFGLGLTSLAIAFRSTTANLVYITPNLPETVTSLSNAFLDSTSQVNLSTLNTSRITNMSSMFLGSTYNQPIGTWDVSKVTDMSSMFQNSAFNQNISAWNTGAVTTMNLMFQGNTVFNQPIGTWNTSNCTSFGSMFVGNTSFNQPIGTWNTSKVTIFGSMFNGASAFNQNISAWNTGAATNMASMFLGTTFNQPIGTWDVSKVTTMANMFQNTSAFNQNISAWNTGAVTDMSSMFSNASAFNQPIGTWDVSKVTNMSNMFANAGSFNQNIGAWNTGAVTNMGAMFNSNTASSTFNNGGSNSINNWNTSNVTNMGGMFQSSAFNQPIGNWNVSKVTTFNNMFVNNFAFNQPIGTWNVSAATTMTGMFSGNSAFNQDISTWNVSAAANINGMFFNATVFNQSLAGWQLRRAGTILSFFGLNAVGIENYSRTLIGWANYVATTDGPYAQALSLTATRQYNSLDYITGARFTNAAAARAFLVGARAVSVTGSSNTDANTSYTYNATTLAYVASNGWYFAIVGGVRWELFNPSNVSQAVGTSTELGTGPNIATAWTGVLSAATVLRTGAVWTITGDALV